jgi:hypothetical protein
MLVKIINCQDKSYWYNNLVGTIVPIHKVTFSATEGMLYWAREGGTWNAINFIKPSDAEVIESEHKSDDFVFAESFEELTKG